MAPEDKGQRNFTDSDSRNTVSSEKSFVRAYNCRVAVDSQSGVIIACEATNQASDKPHLKAMMEQVKAEEANLRS